MHSEVKKYVTIPNTVWKKIDYYYRLRNKLIHERVTVGIDDDQIEDFRDVVERILKKLYKLKFEVA